MIFSNSPLKGLFNLLALNMKWSCETIRQLGQSNDASINISFFLSDNYILDTDLSLGQESLKKKKEGDCGADDHKDALYREIIKRIL